MPTKRSLIVGFLVLETDRGKESKANIDRTKQFLQSARVFETRDNPSFSKFVARLDDQGIRVGIKQTRTGKIQGISYEMDGVALRGSRFGSSYTINCVYLTAKREIMLDYDEF